MQFLKNITSWLGLLALLLLLLFFWTFFLHSSLPSSASILPTPTCQKQDPEELNNSGLVFIFWTSGCQAVSLTEVRTVSLWYKEDMPVLNQKIPGSIRQDTAIQILSEGDWRVLQNPPLLAGEMSYSSEISARFQFDAVLASLLLIKAAPGLPLDERRTLAEAYASKLNLYAGANADPLAEQIASGEADFSACQKPCSLQDLS